jgi:EpsI family protein
MNPKADRSALSSRRSVAIILSLLLVCEAAAYHLMPKTERAFTVRPLREFPAEIDGWRMVEENEIDPEVQKVLRADDTLNRTYARAGNVAGVNLFIAFFRSQTTGAAPHSPKNCLPGSGYAPMDSGTAWIEAASGPAVEVNRYIVARGDSRSLVLYWYQTPARIVASEYAAKFWLVADSLRYRRSDTSLVRLVVPMRDDMDADREAKDFARVLLPRLTEFLPRLETRGE